MRIPAAIALTALLVVPAHADDVPFAAPSATRLGSPSDAYYGLLGDVMALTQQRHTKLWYAASARNWSLATFELQQIRRTFEGAGMFYASLPAIYLKGVDLPLEALKNATEANDIKAFDAAYKNLTKACNECHKAAQIGFVEIQTPTSSPFSDQKF